MTVPVDHFLKIYTKDLTTREGALATTKEGTLDRLEDKFEAMRDESYALRQRDYVPGRRCARRIQLLASARCLWRRVPVNEVAQGLFDSWADILRR